MWEILTIDQAPRYLNVHAETVRRAARSGRLPAFHVGRGWRLSRRDLDQAFSETLIDKELAEEAETRLAVGHEAIPLAEVKPRPRL